ncbi:MAG: hypothetical protein QM704_26025 [Anaeromyxobacteraceae bacterium]
MPSRRPHVTKVLAAALALAAPAAAPRAEPLDLSLVKLGAPSASVWTNLPGVTVSASDAAQLAIDAKTRFATLSIETALAFSSAVMQPASTTGVAGWDLAFEASYVGVHPGKIGTTNAGTAFTANGPWQTKGLVPHELFLSGFHVRKALPYSLEVGGRFVYLSQSNYGAVQGEAKWAVVEGYQRWPDLAIRGAYTAVLGQRDWNLSVLEADVLLSKRFGLNAVASVTPYLAVRWNRITASSEVLDFAPTTAATPSPTQLSQTQARFPELTPSVLRYTLGARLAASTLSVALEGTYFGATTIAGKATPADDEYADVKLARSMGVAGRFGWEF